MKTNIIEKKGNKYVEGMAGELIISTEQDILDLIGICGEHDLQQLLLHPENLCDDFFDLRTGFAGAVLQKCINYGVRVAALFRQEQMQQVRFQEMVIESNRSRHFRVFSEKEEAEEWLLSEWWLNKCKSH